MCDGDRAAVLHRIHVRGDRSIACMLAFHAVTAFVLAGFYDTWVVTIAISGSAWAMFLTTWMLRPGSLSTRCVAGVALQSFVALHIYQLHGLAEMHFFFFTAFAAMLVYQDWRCLWPGALLIIAQHVVFAILHNTGATAFFFEGDHISVTKLTFHFGIALLHVVLCSFWASQLRAQTLRDADIRARLRQAQVHAEQVSAAKTSFIGDMSHELRTPMSGVLSMTEVMLRQPLPEDVRENLEVVRASALAMVGIVDDALDLSRVEAGRLELADDAFDFRRLCEEVAEMLSTRAAGNDVELVVRWQPGAVQQVRGDAGRWRQVLVNLTGNAIKFAAGGHVLIDAGVAPAPPGSRSRLVVRVDDSGVGIPADVLPRLFQRFEQGGAATYARHGGTGLGLAITRQLVERMAGSVSVHTVPGAGTTFVVTADVVVVAAAEQPPRCHARVLLVGRHDLTLGVIAEQLEAMGGEVVVAHDAAMARRRLAEAAGGDRPFQMLVCEPGAWQVADGIGSDLRVVELGPGHGAGNDRSVRIHRYHELQQVLLGPPRREEPVRAMPEALGLRVLLAEDDAVCARVARQMLRMLGCEVVHAADGLAAVAAADREPFDVVLMDRRMPELDGIAATRRIRAAAATGKHLPIVMLSADSLPTDRAQCFDAGADEFLAKPVQLNALRDALARVGRGGPRVAAGV